VSSELHQTLIVANRTAATPDLMAEVERRASARPTAFTLLIPDVPKHKAADWTLEQALKSLRRAAGGPTGRQTAHVRGRVTGQDPVASVKEALAEQSVDDVIVSTLAERRSRWLRRDVPARVRELGVEVTVITAPEEEKLGLKDLPMTGPG